MVHTIFSTLHRAPMVDNEIQPRLLTYMGGILKVQGSQPIVVGGYTDHVHMLFVLSKNKSLSDTLRDTKASSSKWVKETFPQANGFAWQAGYAAYSVGATEVQFVRQYIENQRQHHAVKSFQDELRALCREHGLELDERFVWD